MSKDPVTIGASSSLRDAAKRMRERRIGCIIILEGDVPAGMFTESDLAKAVADGSDLDRTPLGDVMSRPLVTVDATAALATAVRTMKENRVRRLAVVVGNELRGVVTVRDLAFAMPNADHGSLDALRFRWQD